MGPTSPTTPEPECDTFAIAPSGGGLTKRAVDGGDCVACRVFTCACGMVQASIFPWPSPPGQAGFEFFLLPSRVHARPTATNAIRWAARCR